MKIHDLIAAVAERLRLTSDLAGRTILEENKGDISAALQAAVGKSNFAITVGWNGFEPSVQTPTGAAFPSAEIVGKTTVVVSVFEKPVLNRRTAGSLAALDAAAIIAKALACWKAPGMNSPLFFQRIPPLYELSGGAIGCDVEFKTTVSL